MVPEHLHPRETAILQRLAAGCSDQQIADDLVLSLHTVKWYNRQIYSKLHVSSRTQAIARAKDLGLLPDGVAPSPLRLPSYQLPAQPTPFIGRSRELADVQRLLGSSRLVTITGPGGSGKTRLALQAATMVAAAFTDGVCFVDLAPLADPTLVTDAIAQALGAKERPGRPISATLRDQVRAKHLLLLLDNFEHVVMAAPLVAELLAASPTLTVLVTSRAPLTLRAEQQFILDPLVDADAVQLFVQRAQAAGASLAANDANTAVYAAICRRLDRLPLAIELIAGRARSFAPLDLLRQIEQPLQALARGPRDLPARHQSLRQAIRWSYDLLDADQQRVFRCLGVFAGGCTTEAAQAVFGEEITVLPVLETLHQGSLLQQQAVADETRFVLLETIREFALEQLTMCNEAKVVHHHHAAYYARFSMTAYVELLRAQAPRWRVRVAAEQDNLRAAFRWALEHQAYTTALHIATGTWRFHWMTGLLREGLERLETALVYREQAPCDVQSNALRAAGTLATGLHDFMRARRWLHAAVEASRRSGDLSTLQPALTNLGYALVQQGELETARIHLEESVFLARRASDPNVVKFPLGLLAGLHQRLGQYAQARAAAEEGLRINQACQDPEGTANALRTLATIVSAQGDTLRAQHLGEEALALHRSLNHQLGIGLDYAALGHIARMQGDDAGALAHYHHCLALWKDHENIVNGVVVLDNIAEISSRMGNPARGATLMSTAQAIRKSTNIRLPANEQGSRDTTMLACRAALGEATFAAAWAEGRTMTLAQAIAFALEVIDNKSMDAKTSAGCVDAVDSR